ncbi:hypothetical protein DVH24_005957 [Malus domestica]|uniref:Reverse transcriptase zinc-binding domain-containing protein n=1 Tax=Malus domestica TaxID=3750 RepID=A0A498INC9_MALDO|nr:hypothetical protein DVH24_005957 [Malus domestica]
MGDVEDKLIWGPTCNGEFSVKSAHIIQIDDNQCHMFKGLLDKIWKLNIPHKMKFFGWLLVRNKLTTNVKLNKFNNSISECGKHKGLGRCLQLRSFLQISCITEKRPVQFLPLSSFGLEGSERKIAMVWQGIWIPMI